MTEEEMALLTRGRLLIVLHRHGLQRGARLALRPAPVQEVHDQEDVEYTLRKALGAYTEVSETSITLAHREVEA